MSYSPRPEIALIIDSESWAFANIANQLVKHLDDSFKFRIIPSEVIDNIDQILMMTADCSVTHFFWRDFLRLVTQKTARDYAADLGFRSTRDFLDGYVFNRTITTSIYDHLFLTESEITLRIPLFNQLVSGYTVSSRRLMNIYKGIDTYPDPDLLAEDGVDLDLFKPFKLWRFDTLGHRTMVVGWAGNSKWASEEGEDLKGLHTILKPAIQQLQHEGLDIRLELADRQIRHIRHENMPQYYAGLDLYVCPSKIEGTPNPVLESMACGVPVISTDVGIVPQALDDDPFGMILPSRSIEALKSRIRRHYKGGAARTKLISEHGLRKIKQWDWSNKAENFRRFFHYFANQPSTHGRANAPTL